MAEATSDVAVGRDLRALIHTPEKKVAYKVNFCSALVILLLLPFTMHYVVSGNYFNFYSINDAQVSYINVFIKEIILQT